jgi:hypothetical protein
MRMIGRHFLWRGMRRDRRLDGRIVLAVDARLGETIPQRWVVAQPLRRVCAVALAHAVVRAGKIVEKDSRPQTTPEVMTAGGRHQPCGMHHHARHVRLAVQRARMPEVFRQRHHLR